MKVLIVDDDSTSRIILGELIGKLGHEVVEAQNGNEAWDEMFRSQPQVIVCDWIMPEMDGLELCRKIRASTHSSYTYFILVTVRSGREDIKTALEAGIDDFLTKPLQRDELTARLRVAQRILHYIEEVRQLKGLMPICMYCKKIRDDNDYWHQIESYIRRHTGADFTHSICPSCYQIHVKPHLQSKD